MPKQVIKYTCDYKCRTKAIGDRRKMELHEKKCLKNPENKSCMTCPNQIYTTDYDEVGFKRHYRGCKLQAMNDFIYTVHESLEVADSMAGHVRPLVHCPNWGKTEIVLWTESFLNEIRPKIELAAAFRKTSEVAREASNDLPF